MPRVFCGNTKYSKNKTSWNFGNPLPSIVRVQDTFMRSPQSCNNCTFTLGARVLMPMFNSTVFVGLKPVATGKIMEGHLIGDCFFNKKWGERGTLKMGPPALLPAIPAIRLLFVEGIRHPSEPPRVSPHFADKAGWGIVWTGNVIRETQTKTLAKHG